MSGDVQPRKRKDKRRKKGQLEARRSEEYAEESYAFRKPPSTILKDEINEELLTPTKNPTDEVIHVHKEAGLGGNICTKLIFFCLLIGLGVMIGFIFVEYRGSSDEDTQSAVDSPWSVRFEDWVEAVPDAHDDHAAHSEEDHEEEDIRSGEDEGHGSEEEHEENHSGEELDEHGEEDDGGEKPSWFSGLSGLYGGEAKHSEEEGDEEEAAKKSSWFSGLGISPSEVEEESGEKPEEEAYSWFGLGKRSKPEVEEESTEELTQSEEEEELLESAEDLADDDEEEEEVSAEEEEPLSAEEEEPEEEPGSEEEIDEDELPSSLKKPLARAKHEVEESDEEMFPEALAALQQEKESKELEEEEEGAKEDEAKGEDETAKDDKGAEGEAEEEDTSGAKAEEPLTERVEVIEEVIPVIATEQSAPIPASKPVQVVAEKIETPTAIPTPKAPAAEESEDEEEEEEEEEETDEEKPDELELTKKKYEQLLAQYGQVTPESSDVEASDDEAVQREYSEGEEEESGGEAESGGELEGSEPEEAQNWTNNKRNKVLTESEDEEEESEDEVPPPPVVSRRPAGGPKSTEEEYVNSDITNEDDWLIKEELDQAEEDIINARIKTAMDKFSTLLSKHPMSVRSRYGKAKVLDVLAEQKRSNPLLLEAIDAYIHALAAPNIPDALFLKIASRAIDRMRFKGSHLKAVVIHNQLIDRFENTPIHRNNLAINYLMINRLEDAGRVLKEVLGLWPKDAMAQAHYGLVLKLQGKHNESVPYLEAGLAIDIPETRDARLYFHYGDALSRLHRSHDAMKVYEQAVAKGLFRSKYQRSLYNVDHLTARPWWTHDQTKYIDFFRNLEANWITIRNEGIAALKNRGAYQNEAENLRDVGDWKQFELFARGVKYSENCKKTPFTCSLIAEFEPARSCKRGQTKFSMMEGGTHVWPHCGPTNCRLRAHLGLIVPPGTGIRVAETTKTWKEGSVIVFDDSFEHEVWHNGTSLRLVLIVDVWHPELTRHERQTLTAI